MQENPQQDTSPKASGRPDSGMTSTQRGGINQSRRRFARIGAVSPVIMTLASQPVLGAPCLSNMMSGDLYQDRGSCSLGFSPGAWKNPGGSDGDWSQVPFSYGDYNDDGTFIKINPAGKEQERNCSNNNENEVACYINGTTLAEALGISGVEGFPKGLEQLADYSLRDILNENTGGSTGNFAGHFVAALLNAESTAFNYILTAQQLVDLYNGAPVPGDLPLNVFLDSTWGSV